MIENPNLDAAANKAVQLTSGIVEAFGERGGRDVLVRYRDEIDRQIRQIDLVLEFSKRCARENVPRERTKFVPLVIDGGLA